MPSLTVSDTSGLLMIAITASRWKEMGVPASMIATSLMKKLTLSTSTSAPL